MLLTRIIIVSKNLYINKIMKTNFDKEFADLKKAVIECYLIWGYPISLIAHIYNISEQATEVFITEELSS